jgi:glutaredoxin
MKSFKILLLASLTLVFFSISAAEIYKWVDENGVTHYSDAPTSDKLPAETEPEDPPRELEKTAAAPETPAPTTQRQERNEMMKSISKLLEESDPAEAKRSPSVELYVTDFCPWCKKAEQFFRREGVAYTLYNVQRDRKAANRMRSLTRYKGVPFAVINGRKIEGYSAAAYRKALRQK